MDISVVVPLYNEEDNVQLLYDELHEVLAALPGSAEMVFVDDGSKDRTLTRLESNLHTATRAKIIGHILTFQLYSANTRCIFIHGHMYVNQ